MYPFLNTVPLTALSHETVNEIQREKSFSKIEKLSQEIMMASSLELIQEELSNNLEKIEISDQKKFKSKTMERKVLIIHGDTWWGYYAAHGFLKNSLFYFHQQDYLGWESLKSPPELTYQVSILVSNENSIFAHRLRKLGAEIIECNSTDLNCLDEVFQTVKAEIVVIIPPPENDLVLRVNNALQACKKAIYAQSVVFWSSIGVHHALDLPEDDSDIPLFSKINTKRQSVSIHHKSNALALLLEAEELVRYFQADIARQGKDKISTAVLRVGFELQAFYLFKNIMQNRGMVPFPAEDKHFAPLDVADVARATVGLFHEGLQIPDDYTFGPDKNPITLTGIERLSGPLFVTHANEGLGARLALTQVHIEDMKSFLSQTNLNAYELSYQFSMWRLFADGNMDIFHPELLQDLLNYSGTDNPPMTVSGFFKSHASDFSPRVYSDLPLSHIPVLEGILQDWRTSVHLSDAVVSR